MSEDIAGIFSEPVEDSTPVETEAEQVDKPNEEAQEESEPTSEEAKKEPESKPEKEDKGEHEGLTAKEAAFYVSKKEETAKRIAAQKELEEARAEIAQLKAGKQETQEEARPDLIEDPDGFADSMEKRIDARTRDAEIKMARNMMKRFYDDYDEIEALVVEEAKQNPMLQAKISRSDNIPQAVYDEGLKLKKFKEFESFDAESLEKKFREKWEAEQNAKQEESKDETVTLSPSLASARGGTVQDAPEKKEPGDFF